MSGVRPVDSAMMKMRSASPNISSEKPIMAPLSRVSAACGSWGWPLRRDANSTPRPRYACARRTKATRRCTPRRASCRRLPAPTAADPYAPTPGRSPRPRRRACTLSTTSASPSPPGYPTVTPGPLDLQLVDLLVSRPGSTSAFGGSPAESPDAKTSRLSALRHVGRAVWADVPAKELPFAFLVGEPVADLKLHRQTRCSADDGASRPSTSLVHEGTGTRQSQSRRTRPRPSPD